MSNDLERLKSASSLRAWEENRSKSFNAWRSAVESLVAGLRSTVTLGVAQLQQLERFLRLRSSAEQVYVQALNAGLPAATKPQAPHAAPSADAASDEAAGQKSTAQSPLLDAIAELQRAVSAARHAFATGLLESIVVSGLVGTAAEFDKTSSALLQGLDAGLLDVLEAHARAVQAMSAYHRGSIEARTSEKFSDSWLQEHRYRKAVEALRERQQAFTVQLCGAVEEAWRLEEWREEMGRKVLGRFCSKLHQVETTVQSLANDGIRALASHKQEKGEGAILGGLEKVLQKLLPLPAELPPQELAPEQTPGEWPALRQVRALGNLPMPPASVLSVLGGAFQAPRRWYGSQLCVAVLTKDHWLHCFPFSVANVRASTAVVGPAAAAPASPNGSTATSSSTGGNGASLAYLEGVEVEPAWSFYMPASSASTASGKPRTIEIEEVKRGFLGLRMPRRETLLADTDEVCQRWISALQLAKERSAAPKQESSALLPPPPPPPPPPNRQGQQPSAVQPAQNASPKASSSSASAVKVQQPSTALAACSTASSSPAVAPVAKVQQPSAGPHSVGTERSGDSTDMPGTKVGTEAAASAPALGEKAPAKEPPPPPPQAMRSSTSPPSASSPGLTAEDVFGE